MVVPGAPHPAENVGAPAAVMALPAPSLGNVSVRLTPVSGFTAGLVVFLTVMVRVDVPPPTTKVGLKLLLTVSGLTAHSV